MAERRAKGAGAHEVDDSEREPILRALDVSRETELRLNAFRDIVLRWSSAINLVAPGTLPQFWTRHVLDSAQLILHAPAGAESWLDLGSGAGFPGLVVAALAKERAPSMTVTLMESDARKCAFLIAAAQTMEVDVVILRRRIESGPALASDIVSARALAPLPKLLELAARHVAPRGVGLFLKGAGVDDELALAAREWRYTVTRAPSLSDDGGAILKMKEIGRVGSD
ncbi:16S rRNA (guanine(527)-N(7))-methyltransferase RsmG [Rubrimonas cliftonensis]|uniref:Ribosomal RNA small subunit methyltransferase G n=1 Tax=Rubrimonas cliftonensis TaxID=89524 RepID=A0A1H4EET5_9RHOB|nr:16S rRNA (guanine(527)-N(7))-methyltransferase RsmG [Rubrimonas cliftonensis]SEA83100.1 16S rRNA m(7)G-527 methyltransferase [Rubrimonas cliftonensis]